MIGYDPYNADLVIPKFTEQNIECGAIRQGYLTMSPATKKLEMLVLNKEIQHEGDPITRWMMGNVEISMDAAGNIKPDKWIKKNILIYFTNYCQMLVIKKGIISHG